MTTFDFSFGAPGQGPAARRVADRMRILVLADLRGDAERPPLSDRQPRRIDIDTFAACLRRYAPHVTPASDAAQPGLSFADMDDFEPDALFARAPVFAALRQARDDIRSGKVSDPAPPANPNDDAPTNKKQEAVQDTLTRLLGSDATGARPGAGSGGGLLDKFIGKLVADDVTPAAAANGASLDACDAAISVAMRALLHDPALQRLEATWRGLQELVQSVAADDALTVCVLDVTADELATDLLAGDRQNSTLVTRLVEQGQGTFGGEPWDYLVADFSFGVDDAQLIAGLGALASAAGGRLLADADIDALDGAAPDAWRALRASQGARSVCLCTPRVLRRAPYGKQNEAPDSFAFEECPQAPARGELLWGSAALLVATCVAQAFENEEQDGQLSAQSAANDRPMFTFERDGTRTLQPAAETLLSDSQADGLRAGWGVMPIRAQSNGNRLLFASLQLLGAR